jgi:nitroreductase
MELIEALRTTGAAREFTDEPVDDATVADILDTARFAPSGGNRQGWRVAVVSDMDLRQQLAALMQPVWNQYISLAGTLRAPFNPIDDIDPALDAPYVASELCDAMTTIPVVLAIAVDLSKLSMLDRNLERPALVGGASIYPFCWSILLAARAHGLSGVLTTFVARAEPDAGPLLGLADGHALAATLMLGHPVKAITKLKRRPVAAFATRDRFDGPAFG